MHTLLTKPSECTPLARPAAQAEQTGASGPLANSRQRIEAVYDIKGQARLGVNGYRPQQSVRPY